MSNNKIIEFICGSKGKPFVVHFVTGVQVENEPLEMIEVTVYFLIAASEDDARKKANAMIGILSDVYRNSQGQVIKSDCKRILSIEEIDYIDDDGTIEFGGIIFSSQTSIEDLYEGSVRKDLPCLD